MMLHPYRQRTAVLLLMHATWCPYTWRLVSSGRQASGRSRRRNLHDANRTRYQYGSRTATHPESHAAHPTHLADGVQRQAAGACPRAVCGELRHAPQCHVPGVAGGRAGQGRAGWGRFGSGQS